jgi:hypothetical protein
LELRKKYNLTYQVDDTELNKLRGEGFSSSDAKEEPLRISGCVGVILDD